MSSVQTSNSKKLFLRSAATALGLVAVAAQSQTTSASSAGIAATSSSSDAGVDEIIVTGSRLKRVITDTVEPTFIVDAKQIETRGYTNVADALRELPEFGPGLNGVGNGQSGFGPGQSFADFFNLGSQRTLVLIDGVRVVPNITASNFGPGAGSGGSQVDLNTIPIGLLERVETVAVGGAPIYGSDAIAGTVNFILKKNYQGIEFTGESGISNEADAASYRLGVIAGKNFADGRGNITGSFEYDRSEGLVYNDRASTASGLFFTTAPAGSQYQQVLYPSQRLPSLSEQGIPYTTDDFQPNVLNGAGQPVRFSPGGNLIPIDFGTPTGNFLNYSGGNGLNLADVSNLQTPSDRYLGTILANFEFSDHIKAFAQGWFSQSKTKNLVAQGYYNTALFAGAGEINGNFIIPITNPFLTPQARSIIQSNLPAGQDFFYLGRANEDIEPSSATGDQRTYRFVAGLSGDFGVLGHNLNWSVTGTYGKNRSINLSPQVVTQNFNNAVNAVANPDGTIACAPGYTNAAIATISSTCSPLNLFGNGSPSQSALDYITAIARSVSTNELVDVVASVSDDSLIKLPGGDAGFVVGYEHRDERARFDPGTFYLGQPNGDGTFTQYGNSIPINPVAGGFHTNEGFAEINLPFIAPKNNLKFLDLLEVKAAARYVSHSSAGGDFTWTGGGRLAIIPDIVFTGNFTRSIRSPSITELFAPVGQAFFLANDPCDSRYITSGPNPANRAKNCAAAGIAQPFSSNIVDFTARGTSGGNPNLKNEIANSWTAGVQVRPRFAPRLALNVNWVNISLKQAIVSLSATDVLNGCYDATSYPGPTCSNFTRTDGQVTFIQTGNLNAASYEFGGLSASVSYTLPAPYIGATGNLSLNGNYLYTDRLQYRVGSGDLTKETNSIATANVTEPGSRHQATVNLNYDSDTIGFQLQARYFGSAVFNADDTANTRNIKGVPQVVFLNSTLSFNVDKTYTLRLTVDNILNQGSPYPAIAQDTSIYYAAILGRYYRVSVRARF
ncbi:TonB-dependent receptor [Sphingosinicellaceae bacterium]|nr:TonB-dependent receptor [Sphingosinicellaceae bacterium]